jgi:hypothetical protein
MCSVLDPKDDLEDGGVALGRVLASSLVPRRPWVQWVLSTPLGLGRVPGLFAALADPLPATAFDPRPLDLEGGIGRYDPAVRVCANGWLARGLDSISPASGPKGMLFELGEPAERAKGLAERGGCTRLTCAAPTPQALGFTLRV